MKRLTCKVVIPPILFGLLFISLLTTFLLPIVTFNGSQVYKEVTVGLAALYTNKTGELNLFRIALVIGILLAFILFIVLYKFTKPELEEKKSLSLFNPFFISAAFCTVVLYFFFDSDIIRYSKLLIMLLSLCFICAFFPTKKTIMASLFVTSYYSIFAFISASTFIFQFIFPNSKFVFDTLKQWPIYCVAFSLVLLVAALSKLFKDENYLILKFVQMSQWFIPFCLFIYLRSRYEFNGSVISLYYPASYYVVILSIIIGLSIYSFFQTRKYKDNKPYIITASTIITIFAINSFLFPSQVVPSDLWHHGEQITTWLQVIEFGQRLYVDYSPSSGCFAIPIGFFMMLYGGSVTLYNAAYSTVALLFAVVSGFLIFKSASNKQAIFLTMITGLIYYDRGHFILPFLLTLTLPSLIKNKTAWIKVWTILTILAVLYYPTVGIALFASVVPFGIVQAVLMFKNKEITNKLKDWVFWVTNGLVLAAIILSMFIFVPLAKYTLLLVGENSDVNALTLLDYATPAASFLIWMSDSNYTARYILYLITRIFITASASFVPLLLILMILVNTKKLSFVKTPMFLVLSSTSVFTFVLYINSLVRSDTTYIISRTGLASIYALMYMLIGIDTFGKDYFTRMSRTMLNAIMTPVIALSVFCCFGSNFPNVDMGPQSSGLYNDSYRFESSYKVTSDYTLVSEENGNELETVQSGFMLTSRYNMVSEQNNFIKQYGLEDYVIFNLDRLTYNILNKEVPYADSTLLFSDSKSQKAFLEAVKEKRPIFNRIEEGNYEITKWVQDNDYVVLKNGMLVPPELIDEKGLKDYVYSWQYKPVVTNFTKTANSFGESIKSLKKQFDRSTSIDLSNVSYGSGFSYDGTNHFVEDAPSASISIDLNTINGKENDYIYIMIDTEYCDDVGYTFFRPKSEKTMRINYDSESSYQEKDKTFDINVGRGQYLIQAGLSAPWRLSDHEKMTLNLTGKFESGKRFEIKEITFYGKN